MDKAFIKNPVEAYEKLKAENKELKEQLELNTANAVVIDMAQRLYKLKQALKEIKEIAKNGCYDDCNMPLDELVIILQKISEVIDD